MSPSPDSGPPTPAVRYVVFDTETTGLSPVDDRIVELAALAVDERGDILDRFEELIDPQRPIPAALTEIHGIDDSMVAGKPPIAEVLPRFLRFIEGSVLVAHNASYDVAMLLVPLVRSAGPEKAPGNLVLDTCALARVLFPGSPSYKLQVIAQRLGVEHPRAHRAGADVAACLGLLLKILEACGPGAGPEVIAARTRIRLRFGIQEELLARISPLPPRFEPLREALRRSLRISIEYRGGTKGDGAREITPVLLQEQEETIGLLANCHLDNTLKNFRLDRIGKIAQR